MAHGSGVMSIKNTIRNKYTVSEWDLSEIIGNEGDKNMIKSQKTMFYFQHLLQLSQHCLPWNCIHLTVYSQNTGASHTRVTDFVFSYRRFISEIAL